MLIPLIHHSWSAAELQEWFFCNDSDSESFHKNEWIFYITTSTISWWECMIRNLIIWPVIQFGFDSWLLHCSRTETIRLQWLLNRFTRITNESNESKHVKLDSFIWIKLILLINTSSFKVNAGWVFFCSMNQTTSYKTLSSPTRTALTPVHRLSLFYKVNNLIISCLIFHTGDKLNSWLVLFSSFRGLGKLR